MNLRFRYVELVVIFLILSVSFTSPLSGQQSRKEVEKAFQYGNAVNLSNYFSSRITLNIPDNHGEYNKNEATERLDIFFKSHKISGFNVKFKGSKSNSDFIIGQLNTDHGNYRVSIFFRKSTSGDKIHLLRIEKENESGF